MEFVKPSLKTEWGVKNIATVMCTIKDDQPLTEDNLDYLNKTLDSVISGLVKKGFFIRNFQDNSCHYS